MSEWRHRVGVALHHLLAVVAVALCVQAAVCAHASPSGGVPGVASQLEVRAFRFFNDTVKNPVFDVVLPFVTDFKRWRFYALAVWVALVVWGGARGRWAALLLIPLVAASDQVTSSVIKPLVARVRPCEVLGNVNFWYQGERWIRTPAEAVGGIKTSFSFPSSHAANLTASMLFLSLAFRRAVPPFGLALAFLVSLSRIYIGVHWPSDVLAGAAIGALLAVPAYFGLRRLPGVTRRPRAPSPS
jgi:undecaprenyl-diphosphatase